MFPKYYSNQINMLKNVYSKENPIDYYYNNGFLINWTFKIELKNATLPPRFNRESITLWICEIVTDGKFVCDV